MKNKLTGNAVVAQSGGPTTVINSSACGVIQEALRHKSEIINVYGATNGILGIVQEELFDIGAESPDVIEGLRRTPSSSIGSCRYKLGNLESDRSKYERVLAVFTAHNIRYFFYIGGNDSMDTADKINRLATETGYDLRVIGVPKTIDNDLVGTDHCPGFGSVAKYLATCVMEAGRDTEAMNTFDPITITEAMGRNTGWIAAATGLATRSDGEAPNLIYVPEISFSVGRFVQDVESVYKKLGRAYIVVSEGIVDDSGEYVAAQSTKDAFGHRQLGGAASYLLQVVTDKLGLKCRYNRLDTCQRNGMHFASKTDSDEAWMCGKEAVVQALSGNSGVMISLVRESAEPYTCSTGQTPLAEVANGVKKLPREYMDERGTHISDLFRKYAGPLLAGEAPIKIGRDGLPEYIRFQRKHVTKKLPDFVA